jgi:hypothetical protein
VALDPNIRALQFAEQELKDHDRREAELKGEFKELKKTRAALAARVQECIDVLCGKRTPDLFAQVDEDEHTAAEHLDPLGTLGETLLTAIAPTGAGNSVAIHLSVNDETQTLRDLWEWVEEDGREWGGMRGSGLEMLLGTRKGLTAKERRTFCSLVFSFLANHQVDMKQTPPEESS